VAPRDQGENASDLRSPATNAEKTIPYLSSLQLEDRSCVATVLVLIAPRSKEFNRSISSELNLDNKPLVSLLLVFVSLNPASKQ
jgi:hypothetical protein